MPEPIPGDLSEWTETSPTRWERTGHPESGIICVTPPTTFPQYYAERQALATLGSREDILLALPSVIALRTLLLTADGPAIDTWANANANSLPDIRTLIKTLLKLLAARL